MENTNLLACPACQCPDPYINDVEFTTQIICSSPNGCNFNVIAEPEEAAIKKWNTREKCLGVELGDGNFSGCDQSHGDCPVCGL